MRNHFLIAGALAVGAMIFFNKVRGIRNHNPGNIRENQRVDYDWEGEALIDTDSEFEVFESPEYGIRAMVRIFKSYARRGIVTLSGIIATWAPPEDDNDTAAYIASVSQRSGIPPDAMVTPIDYLELIKAMIRHENGIQPYSDELIKQGIALA